MSDEWVDPLIGNPWLQGLPTQNDLRANEFGMGNFTFDPDALEQREDMDDQLRDYLKMRGIYLEDYIPNLPQEIERPDADWVPYTSDVLDAHRNSQAYNLLAQLIEGDPSEDAEPMGFDEAVLAVEQAAIEQGWNMPMLNPGGRLQQFNNQNEPIPSVTVAQYQAQEAAKMANEAGGELTDNPEDNQWKSFVDSGAIVREADGTFVAVPPSNFDMTEFGDTGEKLLMEREKERRSIEEREAALAQYADYINPRYAIDVASMERNGLKGAKTDYALDWPEKPKEQSLEGPGRQSARPSPVSPASGAVGFDIGHMQELAASNRAPTVKNRGPNADLPDSGQRTYAEDRRARQADRQRQNNHRVNETNKADQEYMNAVYQELLRDYKANNQLPSKQQQRYAMMDEFMGTYYRGGA